MLYDSYYKKISKIADFWKKVFKHIVLISIIFGVILAALIAFMVTKGIVFDDKAYSDKIEISYGSDLKINSSALFSGVSYEFSVDGGNTWSTTEPSLPGEYKVRSVANGVFGQNRYGKIYTLSIAPKEIEVAVVENEILYGEALSVSANLQYDDTISCDNFIYKDITQEITEVEPDLSAVKIINKDGEDVTHAYTLVSKNSDIKFLKRDIFVLVEDKGAVYTGKELKFDPEFDVYGIVDGTLAKGDKLNAVFNASIINVGSVENVPELRVLTENLLDVTTHYNIDVKEGKLSVDYRPLIVESLDAKKEYDAEPLSQQQVSVNGGNLADGQKISYLSGATITDIGKAENIVSFNIIDAQNNITTENYSIIYVWGTLEVEPRAITVKTESHEKVYDGEEFKNTQYQISSGTLANGHVSELVESVSLTRVGEVVNSVSILIKDAEGNDKTANYDVTEEFGNITIQKRPITISSESGSWIYDGNVHYAAVKYEGLVDGQEIRLSEQKSVIDVDDGEITNDVEILGIYDSEGNAVIDNYTVNYGTFGTIKIEKRVVTVKTEDGEFIYSGSPYSTGSGYTLVEDQSGETVEGNSQENGFLVGDVLELVMPEFDKVNLDAEGNVIPYKNVPDEYSIFSQNRNLPVTDNYDLTIEPGDVIINKFEIYVNFENDEITKEYNGEALELTENDFVLEFPQESESYLPRGHEFVPVFIGSQTNVGTYEDATLNLVDTKVIFNGEDVTDNFEITADTIDLTVEPRLLIISTGSQSWTYDGDAHTNTEYSAEGLLKGHSVEYSKTPIYVTYVDDGKRDNEIYVVDIFDEYGISVKSNYDLPNINYYYGTLEIVPCTVTVETESAEFIYDGIGYSFENYVVKYGEFADGDVLELVVNAYKNANEDGYDNEVKSWRVYNSEKNKDVTSSYNLEVDPGTIIIKKFKINVVINEGEDKIKKYDGASALTEADCKLEFPQGKTSLPQGHDFRPEFIDAEYSYYFTEVGIYKNVTLDFDNTMVVCSEVDVTNNFEITANEINVIILPEDGITFKPADVYATYNGSAHKPSSLEKPTSDYLEALKSLGYTVDYSFTGEQTNVTNGSPAETEVTNIAIKHNGVDVTTKFDVKTEPGTITVNPQDLYISFNTFLKEKYYDGTPLNMTKSDCSVTGWPSDSITLEFSEEGPVDVGEKEVYLNDITIIYGGNSVSLDNFNIYVNGMLDTEETPKEEQLVTLRVLQRVITVTSGSAKKVYDGTPLYNYEFSFHDDLDQKTLEDLRDLGFDVDVVMDERSFQTEVGTTSNVISSVEVYLNDIRLETGEDKNVNVVIVKGTLEVTKPTIKIIVGEKSIIYDGEAHDPSEAGYNIYLNDELISLDDLNDQTKLNLDITLNGNSVTNVRDGKATVSASYTANENPYFEILVEDNGWIEIVPRELTVTSGSGEWTYDGKSHSNNKATIDDEFTNLGFAIKVISDGKTITDVGRVDNTFSVEVYKNGEKVDEENLSITKNAGTLVVNPRKMVISTYDAEKIYDGNPLTNNEYSIQDDENATEYYRALGIEIIPEVIGTITEPGQTDNNVGSVVFLVNGKEVSAENFDISYDLGTLTVYEPERKPIKITIFGIKREYNGERLETQLSYRLPNDSGLAEGHVLRGIYLSMPAVPDRISPDDLRANNGDNDKARYIILDIVDENNVDVSYFYYIDAQVPKGENSDEFYIAEITSRKIQLTTGSTTAVFKEGIELTNDKVELTRGELVGNHKLWIDSERLLSTLDKKGEIENRLYRFDVEIVVLTEDGEIQETFTNYYEIEIVFGKLEFTD